MNYYHADDDNDQGFLVQMPSLQHQESLISFPASHFFSTTPYVRNPPRTVFKGELLYVLPRFMEINTTSIDSSYSSRPTNNKIISISCYTQDKKENIKNFAELFSKSYFKSIFKRYSDRRLNPISNSLTSKTKFLQSQVLCYDLISQLSPSVASSQQHLVFQSRFQSGNLHSAYIHENNHYYLLVENDTNSRGHSNWFFFKVVNRNANQKVVFHIINLTKKPSLYKNGMKLSMFSTKAYQSNRRGWFKGGENITVNTSRVDRNQIDNYYELSFQYTFQFHQDQVFICVNNPYNFSRLTNFIDSCTAIKLRHNICLQTRTIGYTHSNNPLIALHLYNPRITLPKKTIVFTGRQHPAQTPSSFQVEGIIKELLYQSAFDTLFQSFQVIVLPMLNPDGVIHGHSRCNLAGIDLNRKWNPEVDRVTVPETYYARRFLEQLQIQLIIDLHGHSSKLNSFMYGCKRENKITTRLLPYILHTLNHNFSMNNCLYRVYKEKQCTLRGDSNKNFGTSSYTLQTSYLGSDSIKVFDDYDLQNIGRALARAVLILTAKNQNLNVFGTSRNVILRSLQKNIEVIEAKETQDNQSDSASQLENSAQMKKTKRPVVKAKEKINSKQTEIQHFNNIVVPLQDLIQNNLRKGRKFIKQPNFIIKRKLRQKSQASKSKQKQTEKEKSFRQQQKKNLKIVPYANQLVKCTTFDFATKREQKSGHTKTQSTTSNFFTSMIEQRFVDDLALAKIKKILRISRRKNKQEILQQGIVRQKIRTEPPSFEIQSSNPRNFTKTFLVQKSKIQTLSRRGVSCEVSLQPQYGELHHNGSKSKYYRFENFIKKQQKSDFKPNHFPIL